MPIFADSSRDVGNVATHFNEVRLFFFNGVLVLVNSRLIVNTIFFKKGIDYIGLAQKVCEGFDNFIFHWFGGNSGQVAARTTLGVDTSITIIIRAFTVSGGHACHRRIATGATGNTGKWIEFSVVGWVAARICQEFSVRVFLYDRLHGIPSFAIHNGRAIIFDDQVAKLQNANVYFVGEKCFIGIEGVE